MSGVQSWPRAFLRKGWNARSSILLVHCTIKSIIGSGKKRLNIAKAFLGLILGGRLNLKSNGGHSIDSNWVPRVGRGFHFGRKVPVSVGSG